MGKFSGVADGMMASMFMILGGVSGELRLTMTVCETCGYEVQDGRKHQSDGDGSCQIIEVDTERVVGFANRKYRDLYKRNNPWKP